MTVERAWAEQVAALVREHCGPRASVGIERVNAGAVLALDDMGFELSDAQAPGYDGVIEPGMTLCVESYIGEAGGSEGVKLEQQVLVTENGQELLSTFPFESDLLDQPA